MALLEQLIYFFATLLLLLSFGMLAQRRINALIKLLACQGLILSIDISFVAFSTHQPDLYITVFLTLLLKVWLIPYALYWLLRRLNIRNKIDPIVNLPVMLLIGLGLVVFALNLIVPVSAVISTDNQAALALALASILISLFMMIMKRQALSQVISLLALDNNLIFAATSATHGMPLIVELGVAFDVLIGVFIFGIFFFRIRDAFENFDVRHMEKLHED